MEVLVPENSKFENGESANIASSFNNNSLRLWHHRLAHQNIGHVKEILNRNNIKFNNDILDVCDGCCYGKQHRLPFPVSTNRAKSCYELIHADICGPMEESIGGSKYFLLFKDDFSKYKWVYFIKYKDEVKEKLYEFIKMVKNRKHLITIRTDNGTEFCNKKVEELLKNEGIQHQRSIPYAPEQNGCIEREIRTVVELARSTLHSKELPKKLWEEAINYVVYTLNCSGPSGVAGHSPMELLYEKKFNFDQLKVFGCKVFCHIPKQLRNKFDKKSIKGIFVGYDINSKGFRIYFDDNNKIQLHRDVTFGNELIVSENNNISPLENVVILPNQNEITSNEAFSNSSTNHPIENPRINQETSSDISTNQSSQDLIFNQETTANLNLQSSSALIPDQEDRNEERSRYNLRSKGKIDIFDMFLSVAEEDEPISFEEAINSKYSASWKSAMDEEYTALMKNNTWSLCKLPDNRKCIDCKWVYKIKENTDGTVDRFKARLVAKGFTQVYISKSLSIIV